MYSYLGSAHGLCNKLENECTVCALQNFVQKYWNERKPAGSSIDHTGGIVDILNEAVQFCCPEESAFRQFATTNIQGDPHEFLTYLHSELALDEHPRSERLDHLLNIKHNVRWLCDDCGAEQVSQHDSLGLSLGIRHCKRYETLSLMDYIRQFHVGTVDWFCDSDTCAAIRQIEQEDCPGVARVRKTRDRKFAIVEAPEILAVQLKRSQVHHTGGASREVKVDDKVPFLEELDLSDFTESNMPLKYRLYGVVGHSGEASSGHYIASVRRRDSGYVTISDSRMQQDEDGTWDELRNPSFDGQPFQPVLLFYLRVSSC